MRYSPGGRRESVDAGVFAGFAGSRVAGPGAGRGPHGDCATVRGQPHLGVPGAGPLAENWRAVQSSHWWPSPVALGRRRTRVAKMDRCAARSDAGRTAAAAGRTGAVGQDRGLVAPVKPLEAHLQKKRCTPASKSARTCRRRGAPGSKGSPFWICESSYFWMKRGRPPT